MVSAREVMAQLNIPRQALYRLVAANLIPYEDVTQPYHRRRRYRFNVAAVAAALAALNRTTAPADSH